MKINFLEKNWLYCWMPSAFVLLNALFIQESNAGLAGIAFVVYVYPVLLGVFILLYTLLYANTLREALFVALFIFLSHIIGLLPFGTLDLEFFSYMIPFGLICAIFSFLISAIKLGINKWLFKKIKGAEDDKSKKKTARIIIRASFGVCAALIVISSVAYELLHIGETASCTITSPTKEQIQVIENELDINLSDNCTVTELRFSYDRTIWGPKDTLLIVNGETEDRDLFFEHNIPFKTPEPSNIYQNFSGLNQYDKSIEVTMGYGKKLFEIKEKEVRNFFECKKIFFGKGARVSWY